MKRTFAVVMSGQSLITCPESYLLALKSCYASLAEGNPTSECIKEHLPARISDYVGDILEDHTPLCILGIGSGVGNNDLCFIEVLREIGRKKGGKIQFFERAIEPDKKELEIFRAEAEDLPKEEDDIRFEWFPMSYQEYVKQEKKDDVKFDVVHFFHSIYFVDVETALVHCYEKELGTKGMILCAIGDEKSAFLKYGRAFSSQGLILNPGNYCSNNDVSEVVKKKGWKYVECPGHYMSCNITNIFDHSSVYGNHLLNFLTQWVDFRANASQENLQKVLDFWKNECDEDRDLGTRTVWMKVCMVVILKGT